MAPSSEECKIAGLCKDSKEITCGLKCTGEELLVFYQDVIEELSGTQLFDPQLIQHKTKYHSGSVFICNSIKRPKRKGFLLRSLDFQIVLDK